MSEPSGVKLTPEGFPAIDSQFLDPGGVANDPLTMPGFLGIPFRGAVPNIKEDDPEYKQPQLGSTVHVRIFDLSKTADLEYYEKVWQSIANGFMVLSAEAREYDKDSKTWRVFLRWAVPYSYVPKG